VAAKEIGAVYRYPSMNAIALVCAKRIRPKTAQLPTPDRSSATFIPTTHNSSQRQQSVTNHK
jgi:hypothetical protein